MNRDSSAKPTANVGDATKKPKGSELKGFVPMGKSYSMDVWIVRASLGSVSSSIILTP
jgi:hypothetical protein